MEIKSKFATKEAVIYGTKPCVVTGKRLNSKKNIWEYFIEKSQLLRIFEWVKEEKLTKKK